jgi:hypothetical protein
LRFDGFLDRVQGILDAILDAFCYLDCGFGPGFRACSFRDCSRDRRGGFCGFGFDCRFDAVHYRRPRNSASNATISAMIARTSAGCIYFRLSLGSVDPLDLDYELYDVAGHGRAA